MARPYKTEAVVLRSFRFSEADRVLHLYTLDRGRVGAVAKGVRKTKSRFGARLEPLSHVDLMLHQGSGELQTVTGVQLVRPHHDDARGLVPPRRRTDRSGGDAPPLHRAGGERARVHRADALPRRARRDASRCAARPALDPLALSFQLKLLWLSGYLPHLTSCAECGADDATLVGYSPRAGGAVCRACAAQAGTLALSPEGIRGIESLLASPLADATALGLGERATRDALKVVTSSYEYHGGFRLRTLSA